jgi:hypothetical protein
MTKQKLTLSLDRSVVERARRYSERHGTSVSRLVEDFLVRLAPVEDDLDPESLAPTVRRLIGVARGADPSAYREYLEIKYGR